MGSPTSGLTLHPELLKPTMRIVHVPYDRTGERQVIAQAISPWAAATAPRISRTVAFRRGFAKKMFSEVYGARVRAEVVESILRGNKSCKYRIDLKQSIKS